MRKIKKWLIIIAAVLIIFVMVISSLVEMIYESPLSIFLPSEDSEDDRTGYELIAEETLKLYLDLETIVNSMQNEDPDIVIANSCSRDNMADVIVIYATLSAGDKTNTINPCDFKSPTAAVENRRTLKYVFDLMNMYSVESQERQLADGEEIGRYFITINDDSIYLNPDDGYGECLVSEAALAKLPLNAIININGFEYRVAGTIDGIDDNTISICKASTDPLPASVGTTCRVRFVSTPQMPTITVIDKTIEYHNYDAAYYIETYGLTPEQMEYYNEIADDMDEIAKYTGEAGGSSNTNPGGSGGIDLDTITPVNPNESQKEFIESIGAAAVTYYPQYKILPSLTIAQAILESGWGKSGLASVHNYFGMKYRDGCGTAYVIKSTKEQNPDGSYVTIDAKFRAYSTRSEGIKGYYEFLQYDRYKNLQGVTDYVTATTLIREDGWATSLTYTENLQRLIVQYSLTEYDKKAGVSVGLNYTNTHEIFGINICRLANYISNKRYEDIVYTS